MSQKNNYYVTTPIYYVTAPPHLGSLYSTLLADVMARYQKQNGKSVMFVTGTDEHGQKIATAAAGAGKDPQSFVDGYAPKYESMWKQYDIEYDRFIRTTSDIHKKGVQQWLQKLIDQGDIYKSEYSGWYCTPCETFVTEKDQEKDSKDIMCPSCGRKTESVSEECYFFKLSKYQDQLLEFYENHSEFITPKERLNEVINFVKEGLRDLSISRTTISWGIPFPGDEKHVSYVWADALMNYLTAIGYGTDEKEMHQWWPADLQVMGKDIMRFHAIYWPAFLMASGFELPKKLLVHGWIKVGDQKMSKSLANAVDPSELAEQYGVDPVRYYLLRKIAVTQDSSFSIAELEECLNSDLANSLGNLLNRLSTLATKYKTVSLQKPETLSAKSSALRAEFETGIAEFQTLLEDGLFHRAYARVHELTNAVNAYFHEQEPWKLEKTDPAKFTETLYVGAASLNSISAALLPVMPTIMERLRASIGINTTVNFDMLVQHAFEAQYLIKKIETLFKKHETKLMEEKKNSESVEQKTEEKKESYIDITDVAKVDFRIGTITECEAVEKSEKLLQMQVDFGDLGQRQILAGIRKSNEPESLVGKQGVFIVNLKPRKMMGMLSEGMMVVVLEEAGQVPLQPVREVEAGSKLG